MLVYLPFLWLQLWDTQNSGNFFYQVRLQEEVGCFVLFRDASVQVIFSRCYKILGGVLSIAKYPSSVANENFRY